MVHNPLRVLLSICISAYQAISSWQAGSFSRIDLLLAAGTWCAIIQRLGWNTVGTLIDVCCPKQLFTDPQFTRKG